MILQSLLKIEEVNSLAYNIRYVHGIPNIDNPCLVKFSINKDGISFLNAEKNDKKFFELKRFQINNIEVEDETTIEKRVGFKRMLLVGIFAFAWKKRQVNPLSFLVIEYTDDLELKQEMVLQSDHKNGLQTLNNLKYNIYKFWSEADKTEDFESAIRKTKNYKDKLDKKQEEETQNGCILLIFIILVIITILYSLF